MLGETESEETDSELETVEPPTIKITKFIIKMFTEFSVFINISGLTLTKYYITYGRS